MQQAGRDFDRRTQAPGQANLHSMIMENQTLADFHAGRNGFVADSLLRARARALAQSGNRTGALRVLAEACHPIMDAASPVHTNPDGSPRVWRGMQDGWGHSPNVIHRGQIHRGHNP